ncbi:hypothetical protein MMC26_001070 [Xylographa opegraphella]|nr:hypothetical protein [Xylographa opegraphella]
MLFSTLAFASRSLPEDLREVTSSGVHVQGRLPEVPNARSAVGAFVEVISFWRGTDAIINETYEWLQTSIIGNLFRTPDFDKLPEIPAGAAKTLDLLRQRVERQIELTECNKVPGSKDKAQRKMYMLEIQQTSRFSTNLLKTVSLRAPPKQYAPVTGQELWKCFLEFKR